MKKDFDHENFDIQEYFGSKYDVVMFSVYPRRTTFSEPEFEIENGVLKKYHGNKLSVVIPEGVTDIGEGAFFECEFLLSVTIPKSVAIIDNCAFQNCTSLDSVVIQNGVKIIGPRAFEGCKSLTSVVIPDSVLGIGWNAFCLCESLTSIIIPDSVEYIGRDAFEGCIRLTSVTMPNGITEIKSGTFFGCSSLNSINVPNSVNFIGETAFDRCENLADDNGFIIFHGVLCSYCGQASSIVIPDNVIEIIDRAFEKTELISVIIPDSVKKIGYKAFYNIKSLTSVIMSDSVTEVGQQAFSKCQGLSDDNGFVIVKGVLYGYYGTASSVVIPDSVTEIGNRAFCSLNSLDYSLKPISIVIPDSVAKIGEKAFFELEGLTSIKISNSVIKIGESAFDGCQKITVICREDSYAQHFCYENRITYIFDYQYQAFNGMLPQGFEMLSSPFLADEEKPFIFVSYSHKDRDRVLDVIKTLYEAGWRIWYDEGLTIGDKYDETLEEHIKNCSAFLLFVTKNSIDSFYIKENEIPWAIKFQKLVIKCILDKGIDYKIKYNSIRATVPVSKIEPALCKIKGLTKGDPRVAKGISVVVNPADRDITNGGGFAYCLYSPKSKATAKAIMLDAKNGGCALYDAVENGADEERLQRCSCLIVFLDKVFLADKDLTSILVKEYLAGKEIASCRLEDFNSSDYPKELTELDKIHGLNYVHGISSDMNTKLLRYLQKHDCRNISIMPGFEYEKTEKGIVIKRYHGLNKNLIVESEYGGIPVAEIAKSAFENCIHLETIIISDSVTTIGRRAFTGCLNLISVVLPNGITEIGESSFESCGKLTSVNIPDSVKIIGEKAFEGCCSLISIVIPENVTRISEKAFEGCGSLFAIVIPENVTIISEKAFNNCRSLFYVNISKNVTEIKEFAFSDCKSLSSIVIPDLVSIIGDGAFSDCESLTSINLPNSLTKIGDSAFNGCTSLTSIIIPDSVTYIGNWAFTNCVYLTSVSLSNNITEIGIETFEECRRLASIIIPDGVKAIKMGAFKYCNRLSTVTIPDSVKIIGEHAFYFCLPTVICSPDSFAWKLFEANDITVKSPEDALKEEHNKTVDTSKPSQTENKLTGFFRRIFGKK